MSTERFLQQTMNGSCCVQSFERVNLVNYFCFACSLLLKMICKLCSFCHRPFDAAHVGLFFDMIMKLKSSGEEIGARSSLGQNRHHLCGVALRVFSSSTSAPSRLGCE